MAEKVQKSDVMVDYDIESDSLAIYFVRKKSAGAIELGDIIVDFDNKKDIAGIEFLNASSLLTSVTKQIISREMLQTVTKGELKIKHVGHNIVITFTLLMPDMKVEEAIPIPMLQEGKELAIA